MYPIRWTFFSCLLLALLLGACGGGSYHFNPFDECESEHLTQSDVQPRLKITSFEYMYSSPYDSWMAVFALDFRGADQNLRDGYLFIRYYGDSKSKRRPMKDIMEQNDIAWNESSGRFAIVQHYESISSGQTTSLINVQLIDAAGRRSNCKTLELKLNVTPVSVP